MALQLEQRPQTLTEGEKVETETGPPDGVLCRVHLDDASRRHASDADGGGPATVPSTLNDTWRNLFNYLRALPGRRCVGSLLLWRVEGAVEI